LKILLTGRNGQVGWELERALAHFGEVAAFDRESLDLENPGRMVSAVRAAKPDIIVNAAAYTAVDKAESEPDRAFAVNAKAPGILAEEAKRAGALLVHYSTDYVFDGTKNAPYVEDDEPNPLNVYGRTKLEGERAIGLAGCAHLILRTSWVYGARGKNFLLTILRLAGERDELRIVDDQIGAPTWSRAVAEATAEILRQWSSRTGPGRDLPGGTYHLSASGQTSWYGFAKLVLELRSHRGNVPLPRLAAIRTAEYPLPARRPSYSVLSNKKLRSAFGLELPDWSTQLRICMKELA
jgi:dTDP-4-dehydrorhamnose reductase